jgi:DNA (cytosine-5)-methyltransferase 1
MWETLRIIEQMGTWKPRFVIWENVKNVLSKHMIHNFNGYLTEMNRLGYTNSFEVLNAMDFGLPQKRERVFTISVLGREPFDFMRLERRECKPLSEYLEKDVSDHYEVTQPSMIERIGEGESNFNGRVPIIKDYAMTITCKQMRCPNSGVIEVGKRKYRYLTEKECWRLQGYSDTDYENALSVHPGKPGKLNGALYKQAGNSIPVPIFESIFKTLL